MSSMNGMNGINNFSTVGNICIVSMKVLTAVLICIVFEILV